MADSLNRRLDKEQFCDHVIIGGSSVMMPDVPVDGATFIHTVLASPNQIARGVIVQHSIPLIVNVPESID